MERAGFVLGGLVQFRGQWQAALPWAPDAARRAAVSLLTFAALPAKQSRLRIFCPPISAAEQALPTQLYKLLLCHTMVATMARLASGMLPSSRSRALALLHLACAIAV